LRGAQRLLEDIVDAHQPLQRFQEQQQRGQETGERAGRERSALDLVPGISGRRRSSALRSLNQLRRQRLLRHVAKLAAGAAQRPGTTTIRAAPQ
jgi:hypothetical protein